MSEYKVKLPAASLFIAPLIYHMFQYFLIHDIFPEIYSESYVKAMSYIFGALGIYAIFVLFFNGHLYSTRISNKLKDVMVLTFLIPIFLIAILDGVLSVSYTHLTLPTIYSV